MSELDNGIPGDMPIFRLEKLYLKDLSFENPNAPDTFFLQDAEPTVEMGLKLTNKKLDETHWEICLDVTATVKDTKSDKTMFIIEIEHAGAFIMQNIPQEHMQQVLYVDCPTVIFPYTRQIASQVSIDGGFPTPFLMEPINFMGMYQSKMQKQQDEQQEHQTS